MAEPSLTSEDPEWEYTLRQDPVREHEFPTRG